MAITKWIRGDVAVGYRIDPTSDTEWKTLVGELTLKVDAHATRPLRRILEVVRENGCRSVICEQRYIDADYRSEYSAFWSRRFDDRCATTVRVHFFGTEVGPDDLHALPEDPEYLGYTILRPTELGPVGRTVIAPPAELKGATLTTVCDTPTLFGRCLPVTGVPFYQQDGEFMSCSHAAAWTCHYVAHGRGEIPRRLTADITQLSPAELSRFRALPASGLTSEQLQALFTTVGMPAILYAASDLPPVPGGGRLGYRRSDSEKVPRFPPARSIYRKRILGVVCKYLNSGFPVVVITNQHAFTLVGWQPLANGDVRLIAADDQVGPYEKIDSVLHDRRMPWAMFMIGVPPKVYLTGEGAETFVSMLLGAEADIARAETDTPITRAMELASGLLPKGRISVRSRLMECSEYKRRMEKQGRDEDVLQLYRLSHLPHWVWVVELQDRALRAAGEPCVVAEGVLGATSHDDLPSVHLLATEDIALDVPASAHTDLMGDGDQSALDAGVSQAAGADADGLGHVVIPHAAVAIGAFDPWKPLI